MIDTLLARIERLESALRTMTPATGHTLVWCWTKRDDPAETPYPEERWEAANPEHAICQFCEARAALAGEGR